MESVTIPSRLNGPPESGHGGATAGLLVDAVQVPNPVVTLLAPPPLNTPLVPHPSSGGVEFRAGDRTVARVDPGDRIRIADLPWLDQSAVREASMQMRRRVEPIHPFPTCFGCGHRRPAHDGLSLMAGPVAGTDLHASPWSHASTSDGLVPEWRVWAAIDCPTGHACLGQIEDDEAIVLGRFAVDVRSPVPSGEDHQIVVRADARDGRRIRTVAAVVDEQGTNVAVAEATWVTIRR